MIAVETINTYLIFIYQVKDGRTDDNLILVLYIKFLFFKPSKFIVFRITAFDYAYLSN